MKEMKTEFSQKMNLIKSNGFQYNNTLYGLDLHDQLSASLNEEEMKLYKQLDPFMFFNTINHDNIIIIVGRIIKPIITNLNDFIDELFYKKIVSINNMSIIIIIIHNK